MKKRMFLGANYLIFQNAERLRDNPTHSEMILWGYLKQYPLGFKFRRQHPINQYLADFYCHALKLIIEVDGNVHAEAEVHKHDILRQNFLEHEGINFIRFTNEEVEKKLEEVIQKIEQTITNLQNEGKPL